MSEQVAHLGLHDPIDWHQVVVGVIDEARMTGEEIATLEPLAWPDHWPPGGAAAWAPSLVAKKRLSGLDKRRHHGGSAPHRILPEATNTPTILLRF
jgi:hypothetical protein